MNNHAAKLDQAPVGKWYEQYRNLILKEIRNHLNSSRDEVREQVEDISQEIFKRVLCNVEGRGSDYIVNPKKWLLKIAVNECNRFLEERGKYRIVYAGSSISSDEEWSPFDNLADNVDNQPERRTEQLEQRKVLQKSLAMLAPEVREVVELYYYQELTYEQIAVHSGRPPSTVRNNLQKGLKQLSECSDLASWKNGM